MMTAAAAVLLAACTANNQMAEVADSATVSATVVAVNPSTRVIDLKTSQGEAIQLTATPAMRNFGQIEVGDVATLEMYGSVQVQLAGPGAPVEPQTLAVFGRAPEGDRPGAVAGSVTTATLVFGAYDAINSEAALFLPDGSEVTVAVQPAMRAFAAARTPGERIDVTFSDAIALVVEPG